MKHRATLVAVGAVTAVITLATAVGAASATPSSDAIADQTAAAVAEVALPVDVLAPVDAGGELVTLGDVATATLPATGGDVVEIVAATAGPDAVAATLTLPDVVSDAPGVIADDGTMVYQGRSRTSVAVQGTDDGVRIQMVLDARSAPTQYRFELGENLTPTLMPDGTVELSYAVEGGVAVVGVIGAPWAADANGNTVATSYQVRGNTLIQIVNHRTGQVAYPVVADPKVTYGWGVYYNFNRAETKTLAQWGAGGASGVTAACAAIGSIGGPIGAAAAAFGCASIAYPLMYTAGVANNSSPRRCVQVRVIPGLGLSGVSYNTYRGGNCT